MSKTEILAELPKLKANELAEVQAKLDELVGDAWLGTEELTEADRKALDEALAEYEKDRDAGRPWKEVLAELRARPRP